MGVCRTSSHLRRTSPLYGTPRRPTASIGATPGRGDARHPSSEPPPPGEAWAALIGSN